MMTKSNAGRSGQTSFKIRFGELLFATWQRVEAFICYRVMLTAEAELHRLDDRMLKDIGLHRSEVEGILQELAGEYKDRTRSRTVRQACQES